MAIPTVFCVALCAPLPTGSPAALAGDWVLRWQESTEQRYLEGLRSRRLFGLARSYCRRQLARPDLTESTRAELAAELVHTLSAQASAAPPDQRAEWWQRAHAAAAEFSRVHPDHPFGILVHLQDALTWLAEGELGRHESTVAGEPTGDLQRPRRALRRAIRELQRVRDQLEQLARGGVAGTREAAALWTQAQRASLFNHVTYHIARALRNQGLCYPADSPDRVNSITRAMEALSALANRQPSASLAARSTIEEAECLRWLGKPDRANAVLDSLDPTALPPALEARREAERIRLLLAEGRVSDAVTRAITREAGGQAEGEWEIARLEAILADWRDAVSSGRQQVAQQRIEQATASVRRIERQLGPFWVRRGQRLLASLAASPHTQHDTEALLRAAEGLLHGGDQNDAVRVYDRIVTLARQQQDVERARQAAFAAATIRHRQQQHADAANRYRKVALEDPGWSQAPEAHRLGIFHAAQLARQASDDTRASAVARYDALLREHLDHWPKAPTADRVRLWLGDLRRGQRRWTEALNSYREIPARSAEYDDALTGIARVYDQWLLDRGEGVPRAELRAALDDLRQLLLGRPQRWPAQWTPGRRTVALTISRILLNHSFAAPQAEAILTRAVAGPPAAEQPWAGQATVLLGVAQARQGNADQARARFETARRTVSADTLLDAVRLLLEGDRDGESGTAEVRAESALEQLDALAAGDHSLSDAQRVAVGRLRARAWLLAGNRDRALQAYATLAGQRPDDALIQEAYAELLSDGTGREPLQRALAQWTAIQRKCRVGSDRWFRARLGQARVYFRLGDHDKCARLIKLTGVLMPDLGGPDMKAQFKELAARCQSDIDDSSESEHRDGDS